MKTVFYQWVISTAINFALRQLKKFTTDTDWEKVLADARERIAALVPGEFFDDEAQRLVTVFIAAAQRALSNEQPLSKLLTALADGEYSEAAQIFKDLLLKAFEAEDFRDTFGAKVITSRTATDEEKAEAGKKQQALATAKSFVESYDPLV